MERQPRQSRTISDLIYLYEYNQKGTDTMILDDSVFMELINFYETDHQYEKALEVVSTALIQHKHSIDFYLIKSKLLLNSKRYSEAITCIEWAERISNNDLEIKLIKVQILSLMNEFDKAVSLVNELASRVTKEELSIVYLTESYIYENMSDNEAMYNILYKAAVLDPLNEDILNRLWSSIQTSRFYYKGIKLYKRLIDIQPFSYLAWYHLGNAYLYVGEYNLAIEAMEYSFLINSEFEEGYMEFAELCIQEGHYQKALDAYIEVLALIGEDAELIANIGTCYFLLGDHHKSDKFFKDALRLDNYSDHIYFLRAKNSLAANKPKLAIKSLNLAIDIDDQVEEYYYYLAKAYRMQNDIPMALRYYRKATSVCPEQSFFWKKYITYLMSLKLYKKAMTTIEQSLEYAYDVELYYYNAIVHMKMDDKKQGMVLLEEALKEDFDSHIVIFRHSPELKEDKDVKALIKYYYRELNPIFK